MPLKQVVTVFAFTFRDGVRKKAFIVSTFIIFALLVILCALPRIITALSGDDDTTAAPSVRDRICYFIDEGGWIPNGKNALAAAFPEWEFVEGTASSLDVYLAETAENEKYSIVLIEKQTGPDPSVTVTTKNFMSGISAERVAEVLTEAYVSHSLAALGAPDEAARLALLSLPVSAETAGEMDVSGYALGLLLTMLMFIAIYYYGYSVAMSVALEKTSRVMETLVVSAKPSRILAGKCLASGALGLAQFCGILIFGAICYSLLVPDGFVLFGAPLSLSALSASKAVVICLYFLFGYGLYAVMNAACGASVSRIEDINSAMMPVMLVTFVSFYLGYFAALAAPTGSLIQKIAIYTPFCSPFIVPFKLLNSDVAAADVVISLVLLAVFIALFSVIGAKIYSSSVLHYGRRLTFKDYVRHRRDARPEK